MGVQMVIKFWPLTNWDQCLLWEMRAIRNVSGMWIGITRMININIAANPAKNAMNCKVIATTNC